MGRPKTIYEEITRGAAKPSPLPYVLSIGLPAGFLAIFRLICHDSALVNRFVWQVTTPIKHGISRLCALLPFNVAEICWTVGVLGSLALVGSSLFVVLRSLVYRLQGRQTHPLGLFVKRGLVILAVALWIYAGYTAMWGVNYYADTFSQRSGLEGRRTTAAELAALLDDFAGRCNDLSGEVPRGEDGVYRGDIPALFAKAGGQYVNLYEQFPCLNLDETPPRPMFYSPIMSAIGFTGFYFPFTGESLVNVHAPYCLVPATILHELAHQRNVALEDEANFLAVAVGLSSDDPEFRYSAALMGYIHLSNALYRADRTAWKEIDGKLNDAVRADLRDNNAFWAKYESPASDAAEAVYTSFARSYEQEDIMRSYGACVDLLAAYYLPQEGD